MAALHRCPRRGTPHLPHRVRLYFASLGAVVRTTCPGEPHLTACEAHDAPGACDADCLALAQAMAHDDLGGVTEDPTGCTYRPEDYAVPAETLALVNHTVVWVPVCQDHDRPTPCPECQA